ncbi:hypothetical protein AB7M23_003729 [Pseudomonas sp. HLS-6 TE3448]
MPAMQTPRTHGYATDAIAGKPAPTEPAQPVGAGLARDAGAANSQAPHRRHRRQASSNRARTACRSRACPRYRRRELTDTPPTPSQASQLQQSQRQPVGAGLARDTDAANSRIRHRRYRRQASSNRARAARRSRACRDTDAANSRIPHRRYRRQACSNKARAACRSRACPRCKRRELTDTPPTLSQASLLQQGPRKL